MHTLLSLEQPSEDPDFCVYLLFPCFDILKYGAQLLCLLCSAALEHGGKHRGQPEVCRDSKVHCQQQQDVLPSATLFDLCRECWEQEQGGSIWHGEEEVAMNVGWIAGEALVMHKAYMPVFSASRQPAHPAVADLPRLLSSADSSQSITIVLVGCLHDVCQ